MNDETINSVAAMERVKADAVSNAKVIKKKRERGKPKDMGSGFVALEREWRRGKPQPKELPTMLPLSALNYADSVFQPRQTRGSEERSMSYLTELKHNILNEPDHLVDPITIWWGGRGWMVLDGHHRTMAYEQLMEDRRSRLYVPAIRVKVFEGSPAEAFAYARRANKKVSLNVPKRDKMEAAWDMVCLDATAYTPKLIAESCGISSKMVWFMGHRRRVVEGLINKKARTALSKDKIRDELLKWTWPEARDGKKGPAEWNDEVESKSVEKTEKRTWKAWGTNAVDRVHVIAKAIFKMNNDFPDKFVSYWKEAGMISDSTARLKTDAEDDAENDARDDAMENAEVHIGEDGREYIELVINGEPTMVLKDAF